MSHTKIIGSTKSLYYQFYELARMYWRDMQYSGLDAIEKSKRRAYEVAAQRVGFPLSLCDRLYDRCFQECWSMDLGCYVTPLDPEARMFDLADRIENAWAGRLDCCPVDLTQYRVNRENRDKLAMRQRRQADREQSVRGRPLLLVDPLIEEAVA
ncbi:MAG: hypothetical protein PHD37_06425 [Gallionellaceae bacterium]|nr:hypothetical protein [Gallionellaceae bacterium]